MKTSLNNDAVTNEAAKSHESIDQMRSKMAVTRGNDEKVCLFFFVVYTQYANVG